MARRLTFTTYQSSEDAEPIEVVVNDETFLADPDILGVELLDLVAGIESESVAEAAKATHRMFELAFGGAGSEQHQRFLDYISDRKNHVGLEILMEIAIELAEAYVGGPTESSGKSSSGSGQNGSGSTAKPVSAVST